MTLHRLQLRCRNAVRGKPRCSSSEVAVIGKASSAMFLRTFTKEPADITLENLPPGEKP